jgi:hypothetical protein
MFSNFHASLWPQWSWVYPITEARGQKIECFVAFGEIPCCLVWLVLFSLVDVTAG